MSLKYSSFAALAALATIASMAGQMEAISAQNQTITSPGPLFESPTTLVLSGSVMNDLGNGIDTAKQSGYQIDSVTVFTEETPAGGIIPPVYTVFMSK